MKKKRDFGFSMGAFDVITQKMIERIREEAKEYNVYALGIYTNDFIKDELGMKCIKTTEQRMMIAEQIEGIDFVFPINTRETNEVRKEIEKSYSQYLEQKKLEEQEKYKVGIVIGSFDAIHSGHIENLMLAKQQCEKLAAVVKSDERIQANKHKTPLQTTAKRANVLKELKAIDQVFFMNLETTRKDIAEEISEYYGVEKSDIVLFFGSDLKEKEEKHIDEWEGINVVFTERDEEKMKIVSSSYMQQSVKEQNKEIGDLEEFEDGIFH
jgi:cytidyltransferase-like protein